MGSVEMVLILYTSGKEKYRSIILSLEVNGSTILKRVKLYESLLN